MSPGLLDRLRGHRAGASTTVAPAQDWSQPFDLLRAKWEEIPATHEGLRRHSTDLLALSDDELLAAWKHDFDATSTGHEFQGRGWYHTLYVDALRGKNVLDVGSGLGVSSMYFAEHGTKVTFLDIHPANIEVLKRLARIKGLDNVEFAVMEDVSSLEGLARDYDVILAIGSLHNAPQSVMRPEIQELLKHLKIGGRWLQFAYPKGRWEREGGQPFSEWGAATDGEGTPWCEWYDVPKLLALMEPARMDVVLYYEFHNGDFNWFDFLYRG